ncbi:methyltransferase domain-containing protein [Desulfovibrio sp. SGI.169]|uniref:methyltransferase domain-containing protein n=1 Tax=Desulfovibrio sp. SGI.169 TaxID=3420561 RepID=UPI003D089692
MRRIAITVDVEAHAFRAENDHINRLIWGRQHGREQGIGCMMDMADKYGVPITFFVDYPEYEIYGEKILDVAREVMQRGHDAQPHCHAEYLAKKFFDTENPGAARLGIATQTQTDNIAEYLVELHTRATSFAPVAHRSRGYELSAPYLDSLKNAGFTLDASYSLSCKRDPLRLGLRGPFRFSNGLLEIPVPFVPYFQNAGPLIPWNFNHRCFLTPDMEENLQRHEAFLDAWFKRHGDGAVATLVMHSWSFWKMDSRGLFTIPDDAGVELFERLLDILKTKYEIVALGRPTENEEACCDQERVDARLAVDHCPVCYEPVSHFQDDSAPKRRCPFCQSLERHRTLVDLVYSGAFGPQVFHEKNILHIAPIWPESLLLRRMRKCRVTTLNIQPGCDMQADIQNMPEVADGSFDIVLASGVFRHVKDLDKALAEIARVLRPGGLLLCSDSLENADYGREITDEAEQISWYGKEKLDAYGIGDFRRFGCKDWEEAFKPYFYTRVFKAEDKATGVPAWWMVCVPRNAGADSALMLSAPLLAGNAARILLDASAAPIRYFLPDFQDWPSYRSNFDAQNLDWLKETIFVLQFTPISQVCSLKASLDFPLRYPSHIHPYPFQSFTYLLHELQTDTNCGDSAALQRLSREIERWIDAYGFSSCSYAWDRHTRWMVWHDTATGLRLDFMAYLLLRILPLPEYSDEFIEKVFRSAIDHFLILCAENFLQKQSNHGVIQMISLLAFCRGMQFLGCIQEATHLASLRLHSMFTTLATGDGMWKEHSSSYQAYMVRILDMAQTFLAGTPWVLNCGDKMRNCLACLIKPDGNLAEFGDTEPEPYSLIKPVVAQAISFCEPLQNITLLSESGYVFLHTQSATNSGKNSFLAMSGAFHSIVHKHCDDLSFIWSEGKQNLLVDSGMQSSYEGILYSGPLWEKGFDYSVPNRVYSESIHAHNCVEINGESYSRRLKPYGALPLSGRQLSETCWLLKGEWQRPEGFRQVRRLVFSPTRWLLILDELEPLPAYTPGETKFSQWFHLDASLDVISREQNSSCAILHEKRRLHCQSLGSGELSWHKGEFAPRLQGWQATESTRWLESSWAIGVHQQGKTARFATLFSLCGPCIAFGKNHYMFHLQFADEIYDSFTL